MMSPVIRSTSAIVVWARALALTIAFVFAASAQAQVTIQKLTNDDIGLNGYVRPGGWTPLRLTLDNQASAAISVICKWEFSDADGEQVFAERRVTLSPNARQSVTLYAQVPANTGPRTLWRVYVSDAESGKMLDTQSLNPARLVGRTWRMIGVTGPAKVGLNHIEEPHTQHEGTIIVQGLDPRSMPDRWFGLRNLSALIWTSDSADPADPNIARDTHSAIHEWVRRGGHLIISPAAAGDLWTGSPLADLLPVKPMSSSDEAPLPWWMGDLIPESSRVGVKALEPVDDAEVLLREKAPAPNTRVDQGKPTVVTRQFGLGRVTVIGVDLVDPRIVSKGMPAGRKSLWNRVLGLQGPNFTAAQINAYRDKGRLLDWEHRQQQAHFLDSDVISPLIDMQEAAAAPLLLAIVAFGMYWLAAGPIGYAYLRQQKKLHHSWLLFVCVVISFGVIAWIGGMLLRPSGAKIRHFSVMNIDGTSGTINTKSWLSLYVPTFGDVDVRLERSKGTFTTFDAIGAPGLSDGENTFTDARRYTYQAAAPEAIAYPFRATAKQLELDYLGEWNDQSNPFAGETWAPPQGHFKVENNWPAGKATHALPGTLHDCNAVFVRGDGRIFKWSFGEWKPGVILEMSGTPRDTQIFTIEPANDEAPWGGYLQEQMREYLSRSFIDNTQVAPTSRAGRIKSMELLTFFDALPPPKVLYKDTQDQFQTGSGVQSFARAAARQTDISGMLGMRRLIIYGHLEEAPLMAPLKVNGGAVQSKGWTMVRWVVPLSEYSGSTWAWPSAAPENAAESDTPTAIGQPQSGTSGTQGPPSKPRTPTPPRKPR